MLLRRLRAANGCTCFSSALVGNNFRGDVLVTDSSSVLKRKIEKWLWKWYSFPFVGRIQCDLPYFHHSIHHQTDILAEKKECLKQKLEKLRFHDEKSLFKKNKFQLLFYCDVLLEWFQILLQLLFPSFCFHLRLL